MRWWRRGSKAGGRTEPSPGEARRQLADFVASRWDVQAWIEPENQSHPTTILLIAHDGEWLRRPAPSRVKAFEFAGTLGIPVHDANLVPYPQSMREWTSRNRSQPPRTPWEE